MQQQGVQPEFSVQGGHLIMSHQEQTGLPQVKDATVNDRDRMQDLLAQEKYLTIGYNMAMIEASHEALFQTIRQNFDACHQMQRQLFNLMFKKGWYKLPVAKAEAVAHTLKQFEQYRTQFPFPPGGQGAGQQAGQMGGPMTRNGGQTMQSTGQTGMLTGQTGMQAGRIGMQAGQKKGTH